MAFDFDAFEAEYYDLVQDVLNSKHQNFEMRLTDFIAHLDAHPPVKSAISAIEPKDFQEWYKRAQTSKGSMVGSATLPWERDRTKRLGQELALLRHFSEKEDAYLNFALDFMYTDSNYDQNVYTVSSQVFDPTQRNLLKYLKRTVPSVENGVPASDRVVRLDHNSADYRDTLSQLSSVENAVRESNSIGAADPENRDRTLSEIAASRQLLGAPMVRASLLWGLVGGALMWLLGQVAGHALEPTIKALLSRLSILLNAAL